MVERRPHPERLLPPSRVHTCLLSIVGVSLTGIFAECAAPVPTSKKRCSATRFNPSWFRMASLTTPTCMDQLKECGMIQVTLSYIIIIYILEFTFLVLYLIYRTTLFTVYATFYFIIMYLLYFYLF